jgi:dienelactone hydrolase
VEWHCPVIVTAVMDIVDTVATHHGVDPRRLAVTGVSMGGLGSWMFPAARSERFAAAVPMCGGGKPLYARLLKEVPLWFFHAVNDAVIAVAESEALLQACRAAGHAQVHLTRIAEGGDCGYDYFTGHNCWDAAYSLPELWQWVLAQCDVKCGLPGVLPVRRLNDLAEAATAAVAEAEAQATATQPRSAAKQEASQDDAQLIFLAQTILLTPVK